MALIKHWIMDMLFNIMEQRLELTDDVLSLVLVLLAELLRNIKEINKTH